MNASMRAEHNLMHSLNGIPEVDIAPNLQMALNQGRRAASMLHEVFSLRCGVGTLTPQEYFYYRLWDHEMPMSEKSRFVGKITQYRMHVACNDRQWYSTAADKILFHTIMDGAGLPVPTVLAVTQEGRRLPGASTLTTEDTVAALLRKPDIYPLFAKPAAGKYSLSVISADRYDATHDEIVLLGGKREKMMDVAASLIGGSGYLVQSRLVPGRQLAVMFGPRLWSVRLLVLLGDGETIIHRAVAKIATGNNSADNYWRTGNMLGAIDLDTGQIIRTVCGTGADLVVNERHPDTDSSIVGTMLPAWDRVTDMVKKAATIFAGIRTQSWDVALTDRGPVLLEVNYGGDLNLHQLAHGAGVLDPVYENHLRRCGYRLK